MSIKQTDHIFDKLMLLFICYETFDYNQSEYAFIIRTKYNLNSSVTTISDRVEKLECFFVHKNNGPDKEWRGKFIEMVITEFRRNWCIIFM